MWPNRRLIDLFEIEHPILLAPMAGAMDVELAVAVAEGRGLAAMTPLLESLARSTAALRDLDHSLRPTSDAVAGPDAPESSTGGSR